MIFPGRVWCSAKDCAEPPRPGEILSGALAPRLPDEARGNGLDDGEFPISAKVRSVLLTESETTLELDLQDAEEKSRVLRIYGRFRRKPK